MSRDDEIRIRKLIELHSKRLFELKKQQAVTGLMTEPRVLIEIETIEAELETLSRELDSLDSPGNVPDLSRKVPDLPRKVPDTPRNMPDPPRRPTPRLPILIVEDEKVWQDILQETLAEMGCPIDVAGDFVEARDKLQTGQFSLITLDAHLRSETTAHEGILLLDYIRKRFGPDLPVIVISGAINKRDVIKAFRRFAVTDVFLKEDFAFDEFLAAVREAIDASTIF